MNKVHLFIPSSAVRCHSLKTGLSKNTAHFFLPASVSPASLFHTHTHTDEEKVVQDAFKSKYTVYSIIEFILSTEGHQASSPMVVKACKCLIFKAAPRNYQILITARGQKIFKQYVDFL